MVRVNLFERFAIWVSDVFGSPGSFLFWVILVTAWGMAGSSLHYSDTWQLMINTPTTIIELFAAVLIQFVGNRIQREQKAHEEKIVQMLSHIEAILDHHGIERPASSSKQEDVIEDYQAAADELGLGEELINDPEDTPLGWIDKVFPEGEEDLEPVAAGNLLEDDGIPHNYNP